MKLKIEIDMGNAAFSDYPKDELICIFHEMLPKFRLDNEYEYVILRDTDGNIVGRATIGSKPRKKA